MCRHGRSIAAGSRRVARHKRSFAYVGTALALAGAGSALGATTASAATGTSAVATANTIPVGPGAASAGAVSTGAASTGASLTSAGKAPATAARDAVETAVRVILPVAASGRLSWLPSAAPTPPAAANPAPAELQAASHPVTRTWLEVRNEIIREQAPGALGQGRLPLSERLMPVGTSGPQAWMPVGQAQIANATTIVRQAFGQRMGIRSAVIAVATAMQESQLLNVDYGDENSLGLFQQRPGFGWGSPQQILDPAHAADAFLAALRRYQAADPGWAGQPLWATAQAVQQSGFPFAYAQWETQAANLVRQIAMTVP